MGYLFKVLNQDYQTKQGISEAMLFSNTPTLMLIYTN